MNLLLALCTTWGYNIAAYQRIIDFFYYLPHLLCEHPHFIHEKRNNNKTNKQTNKMPNSKF